jgi:chromosome segregation protein
VFLFAPGITALVGPNGSGKSNIVDALRWVFGEQNPRSLRGSRWEEVIFAGSVARRPLGLAEVVAVLDNSAQDMPVPYREVEVSRRLLRSGDGEYAIGRVPCRLKDIHDLTAGTGAGSSAYAYVPQAAVDEVLKSRPEDRRAVIEEAAGLSRYRGRQQEAQRRLAEVDDARRRLDDLLAEVDGQLAPLAAEAEVAMRYLALRAEHEDLSARLWADAAARARRRLETAVERVASLRANLEQLDAGATAIGEELGAGRAAAAQLRRARMESDSLARTLLTDENRRRAAAAVLQERLATAKRDHGAWTERVARLAARLAEARVELAGLAQPDQASPDQARPDQARPDQASPDQARPDQAQPDEGGQGQRQPGDSRERAEAAEAEQAYLSLEGLRRAAAAEERAAAAAAATAQAEHARAAETLRGAAARLSGLSRRIAELERQTAAASADGQAQQQAAGASSAAVAKLREQRDALRTLAEDLEASMGASAATLAAARSSAGAVAARLGAARERWLALEAAEGRLPLAAAALETADRLKGRRAGSVGAGAGASPALLASLIEVDPGFETALSSALGLAQFALLLSDWTEVLAVSSAREAVSLSGAVVLLPAHHDGPAQARDQLPAAMPGVRRLIAVVRSLDEGRLPRAVLDRLLGHFWLTPDLPTAIAAVRGSGGQTAAVTALGQAVLPGGLVVDGPGAFASDLIGLPAEQAALKERIEGLEQELAAARSAEQDAGHRHDQISGQLKRAMAAAAEASRSLDRETAQHSRLAAAAAAAAARLGADQRQLAEVRRETELMHQALAAAKEAAASAEAALIAAKDAAQGAARSLASADSRLASARDALQQARLELAQREQARIAAGERQARLSAEAQSLARDVADGSAHAREAGALAERLRAELAEAQAALARCQEQREAAEADSRNLTRDLAAQEATVRGREAELDQTTRARRDSADKLHQAELVVERLQGDQRSLTVERRSLPARFDGLEPALAPDAASARARREAIEVELSAIGQVNLGAAEQVRRLAARRDFLAEQRHDLEASAAALRASAAELEREIESRFLRCFSETRSRFAGVFADLFGGGLGDLQLTQPDQPLTSGVEILAQPPGKRMTSLSLLSGGERALTAIALLFSLLGRGRTGFCVLDEVDAHLDEVNCQRFCRYLRSLAGQQQFLVVTHSKATMEAADVLYGLTMEEDGVSRVISVRLDGAAGRAGP